MSRSVNAYQPLVGGGASGKIFLAHGIGNEIIGVAVDEKHGELTAPHGFNGGILVRIKFAVDPRPQLDQGVEQGSGKLHIPHDLLNDGAGGGIAAIGQHANHVWRHGLGGRKHHGGGSHGDSRENNLGVGIDIFYDKIYPRPAIQPFQNAKGDHSAVALATASMIHDQGAAPQGMATRHAAAEIPLGPSALAESV